MPVQKHTHKLKRTKYKKTGTPVYFCVLNCTHRILPDLALGQLSICWRCGEEFTLNQYSIRRAMPACPKCFEPRESRGSDKKKVTTQKATQKKDIVNDLSSRLSLVLGNKAPVFDLNSNKNEDKDKPQFSFRDNDIDEVVDKLREIVIPSFNPSELFRDEQNDNEDDDNEGDFL